MPIAAALALPGAIETLTGGSFYDRRLVEAMRALGHRVEVVTLPGGFPAPGAAAMAEAVARLVALPGDRPVIVDGLAFGALPTEAVARIRAPIVALVHHPLALEPGLEAGAAARLHATERANLAHARAVLVPSPHVGGLLLRDYGVEPGRLHVLRPGIDRRPPGAAVEGVPQGAEEGVPLILSVGILHPRKGHDVLIEALGRIADLDWRAVIIGNPWDAAHAADLEARIAALPCGGRVRLAGRVADAERDALYAGAAVFALATRYEGYGIVFNEAMVQGLPIVSCLTGAVPDTVPEGAGLLVPPDDARAFAGALRRLLEDEGLRGRMAAEAARAGAALPGWEVPAARAAAILTGIMEAAR